MRCWWRSNDALSWQEGYVIGHCKPLNQPWRYFIQWVREKNYPHGYAEPNEDTSCNDGESYLGRWHGLDRYVETYEQIIPYSEEALNNFDSEMITTW